MRWPRSSRWWQAGAVLGAAASIAMGAAVSCSAGGKSGSGSGVGVQSLAGGASPTSAPAPTAPARTAEPTAHAPVPIDPGSPVANGANGSAGGGRWTSAPSFSGPYWDETRQSGQVVVLEDTISVKEASADRNWVATGLVRNETSGAVAGVTVVANVTDANGSPVGDITADVPVAPLRKGEPAPFEVTTAAERPGPFTIRWSARWRTDDPGARSGLKLETHWDRVIETGQPLQISGYPDSDRSEPRFALFGSAEPEEGVVARSPVAVAAWFDDAGRVIRVATTPMVQPGTDQARAELEQGEIGDFAFVIRGSDVSGLAGARHALWGVAR